MKMQQIEHVKDCRELMQESADKANLTVVIDEYMENNNLIVEIKLRDKDGYLITKSYGDVGFILGFIRGYMYKTA